MDWIQARSTRLLSLTCYECIRMKTYKAVLRKHHEGKDDPDASQLKRKSVFPSDLKQNVTYTSDFTPTKHINPYSDFKI
uniref:Uncharacterized protein n=1 Tax=Arion vulgaris TaxID=1028688 RepID=A0A0B7ALI2_9EUPU